MPRLLCVIVKPQIDACAAFGSKNAATFDYASVLQTASLTIFATGFSLRTRRARARNGHSVDARVTANHPRLNSWAPGRDETVANPCFSGPSGLLGPSRSTQRSSGR